MIPSICENIMNLQLLLQKISFLEVLENTKLRKIRICDFFHGSDVQYPVRRKYDIFVLVIASI